MKASAWIVIPSLAGICFGQITVPEGTKVRVRLEQNLSSATAEENQPVQLSVTDEVRINGVVAIAQDSTVTGTIVQAVPKRRLGRTGKLDFSIDRVVAADGSSIPLRYSINKREGGSHSVRTGILAAGAAVVFWPAAPVFLLMKGKDVTMHQGMIFDVFTDEKHVVQMPPQITMPAAPLPAGAVVAAPAAARPAGDPAILIISSDTPGADIEMDGAFVGDTPTTLHVTPGLHVIVVKNGGEIWQRNIQVQSGSSISLVANLRRK